MCSIVLDPRSIVDSLSFLKVDINVEDIIRPRADRIQNIYHSFCTQVLEVPEKSLSELPFEFNTNSETAEIHHRSTPLVLLFTTMRCFITDFGDDSCDFTMCDLISPQPKRTRRLLSVVADFADFYMKASHAFEKTRAEYDDARRAIDTAQEEVRLAEERKNTLLNEQGIRKRKENELLAELNSKQAALRELWKEGELCEKRRDAVWNSIKDGREEIVNLRRELKSLSSKIDHVSNGIIKSPTRFLLDVEDQKASIKSLQKQCDTERQRICDNEEAIRVVEQISKALDELSRKVDQFRDWQSEINRLEQNAADCNALREDFIKKTHHTEEMLSKLVISSEEQAKTHERTYELYSSRLQDLKSRMEELSSVVKKLQENGCSGRNELSQLKKELVRLRNEKIREEETVRTSCLELHRLFNDLLEKYHRAEEKFNMESRLFSDVLHSISSALDDTEDAASDEVI